jgi:hypothetical protein
LPWPAARPAVFRLSPCMRLLGLYLRALGRLPLVSPALSPSSHPLAGRHSACTKAIWSGPFLRESELRHLALIPTRNEWALGALGKQPVAHPPVLDRLFRAQSRNDCALVIFAALAKLPRRRLGCGAIFNGGCPNVNTVACAAPRRARSLGTASSGFESILPVVRGCARPAVGPWRSERPRLVIGWKACQRARTSRTSAHCQRNLLGKADSDGIATCALAHGFPGGRTSDDLLTRTPPQSEKGGVSATLRMNLLAV